MHMKKMTIVHSKTCPYCEQAIAFLYAGGYGKCPDPGGTGYTGNIAFGTIKLERMPHTNPKGENRRDFL